MLADYFGLWRRLHWRGIRAHIYRPKRKLSNAYRSGERIADSPGRIMHRAILLWAMLFATLLSAQTTATINMQQAVASSQEGIKRSALMRAKWAGPLAAIERREAEIKAERETLDRDSKRRHGVWPFRHVMSAKEKAALSREIDLKAKAVALQRERDRGDFEAERRRIVGQIASRMTPIVQTYAKDHGYSLVLDSGQQDGPVIVASNDITGQIVSLFDHAFPTN